MTKAELKQLRRLIKKLNECREIADRLELTTGNGGEVGGLIGSLADELEVKEQALEAVEYCNGLGILA